MIRCDMTREKTQNKRKRQGNDTENKSKNNKISRNNASSGNEDVIMMDVPQEDELCMSMAQEVSVSEKRKHKQKKELLKKARSSAAAWAAGSLCGRGALEKKGQGDSFSSQEKAKSSCRKRIVIRAAREKAKHWASKVKSGKS